jgi:type II secretory pathway pseudopilin PulG
MTRGATLLELLLVLLIFALLAGLTMPAFGSLRDQLQVKQAAELVAAAHVRARVLAAVERRVMLLTLTADSVVVRAVENPGDTVERWRTAGPGTGGVRLSGFPRRIAFGPSGIALGLANGSYGFDRGAAHREVIVSRYGRVRQN